MLRKWLLGIFVGIVLLLGISLAVLVVSPFFVDIDRFRPEIENAINARISSGISPNYKLRLGKLTLTVKGPVRVDAADVRVLNSAGNEILRTGPTVMQVPLDSIFSRTPTLKLKAPGTVLNGQFDLDTVIQFENDGTLRDYSGTVEARNLDLSLYSLRGKTAISAEFKGTDFADVKAKGKVNILQADLVHLDVMKLIKDVLDKVQAKLVERVPSLKSRELFHLPTQKSVFEQLSADFSIDHGKITIPQIYAKGEKNKGLDVHGKLELGLLDLALKASIDISDPHNLTHIQDISINQSGIRVPHLFMEGNSPIHFPIEIGCNLITPCYNYDETPEELVRIAVTNFTRAVGLGFQPKAELIKKAKELLDQAPPELKERLKRFFK